ncbi:MAG: glycosyltransferase family 4 protein [bacterium]|nr:glycosyltransferase family 4 protein [bacterium]
MKILALNWNDLKNPYAGGAEVHLEELLRRLVSFGHEVTLFCSGWSGCKKEETIDGVRIIRRGNRYNFNLIAPLHLRKIARDGNFDLLVEDINKIPFYTPLYLNLKTLVVIPHLFATTVFHEINYILGSYIYLAEKPMVPVYRGCKYNVISESTADDIALRGVPRSDISIIHCGIDSDFYRHDPSLKKYERPTTLYLGRLKKYKSIHHLIVAFSRVKEKLPDAQLMIVGAGDYAEDLKKLTASLRLDDAIEFTGFVSKEDKLDRLRRSHVAVLPSLKEGWGLTNIEANAVGTTVIAANSPGLRDSVSDGHSGLLYEYGDIDQLTEKLYTMLSDSAVRQQLEAGALEWASRFNWDIAARKFEQVINEIAEGA